MEEFHYERFNHPHPRGMQKMEALWLKSQGLSHNEICRLCRISPNTLREYLREFIDGGLEKLKEVRFHGRKSELSDRTASIEIEFRRVPPATLKEAAERVSRLTGIRRSLPQIREFILKIGMKRLKSGTVPGKADAEAQREFQKKLWMFA
jgi:transposase